jgi:hypothetical protein
MVQSRHQIIPQVLSDCGEMAVVLRRIPDLQKNALVLRRLVRNDAGRSRTGAPAITRPVECKRASDPKQWKNSEELYGI